MRKLGGSCLNLSCATSDVSLNGRLLTLALTKQEMMNISHFERIISGWGVMVLLKEDGGERSHATGEG